MPDQQPAPEPLLALRRAFLLAYGVGVALCVIWPLILQVLLGRVLQPGFLGPTNLAQDLGYTFTGLVVLSALYVIRRSKRVRSDFATLEATQRTRVMSLEILFYAALFELSAFFGLLYHGLGGPQTERYARTFIALSTVLFLGFVPRFSAWRKALEPGIAGKPPESL